MSALERVSRLARAAVFAAVCVVVSAGGHVLAGGVPVAVPTLLVGVLGAFALAFALNGRQRGPETVVAATAAAQILLHELFTRSAGVTVAAAEHVHTGTPGAGMAVAHLVIAVMSGWWLYRGESAFWLMVRLWGTAPLPKLRRLLAGVVEPFVTPVAVVLVAGARTYRGPELVRAILRRGPPVAAHAH
ncbi:MFS transporter [Nonomuraea bangladeshensis]|uniref:MFS transporter n=1 Tax=Nonomuraea bangladeshensis TaxID=404385 RepID=UPI003C2FBBB7